MEMLYTISLENGSSCLARGHNKLQLAVGDFCVIKRDFCQDYGRVTRCNGPFQPSPKKTVNQNKNNQSGKKQSAPKEQPKIIRLANDHDKDAVEQNKTKAAEALAIAKNYVKKLELEMKLLSAYYSLDRKFALFQFTADGRVDFRQLVKDLSQELGCRIELRQIGVRDETSVCGGIGVCGQELCCHRFLKDFQSINVKMAKEQDLSLTPSTISGICGRLKCCLKYEHAGYLEMEKDMPRRGDCCSYNGECGKVCDRNLLTQDVSVYLESGKMIHCNKQDLVLSSQSGRQNKNNRKENSEASKTAKKNFKQNRKPSNKQR